MDNIKKLRAIGLMSGTSLDGVDIALIETDGIDVYDFGRAYTVPYDETLREQIRSILGLKPDTPEKAAKINLVENSLTAFHAEVVNEFMEGEEEPVDIIGFHGHTIHHEPENHYTHQIGDGQSPQIRLTEEFGDALHFGGNGGVFIGQIRMAAAGVDHQKIVTVFFE